MENNVTDSGSRVTRSLRKRLTSVDSDNSSRPGTPVPTKLISMLEKTASPSRSTRMTRRNSTSGVATPVKTPSKRGVNTSVAMPENSEAVTPARRTTRRRSVYENEEISQTFLKTISFAALVEESESSGQTTTRVTRSQSKSPQQLIISKSFPNNKQTKSPDENENKELEVKNKKADNQRRRKPGPKSKTRERDDSQDLSDVEINVFENDNENFNFKSSNIPTIVLTDEESNLTAISNTERNETQHGNGKSPLPKVAAENVIEEAALKTNTFENKINTNVSPSLHSTEKETTSRNDKKTKTREQKELHDLSDVKISVLGNDIEDLKYLSIVLNDEESNLVTLTNTEENKTHPVNKKSPLPKLDTECVMEKDALKPNTFENKLNTNLSSPSLHLTQKQITPKNAKTTKTPKQKELQDLSEDEIIVHENDTEDLKNRSSNIKTNVLNDEESNLMTLTNTEEIKTQLANAKSPLPKHGAENVMEKDAIKPNMFENKLNTNLSSPSLHLTQKQITPKNAKTTKTTKQKELHDLSEDEIIVLENDIDDFKYRSSNIPTNVLNDEDSNLMALTNTEENNTHPANEKSPSPKHGAENVMEKDAIKPNMFENKLNTNLSSPSLHLTQKQITPKNAKTTKAPNQKELQDLSEDEIIVHENDTEDLKNRSSNIKTNVLNDEESNLMTLTNTEEIKTQPANAKSPLPKLDAENVMEKDSLKPNTFENNLNTNLSPTSLHLTEKQITPKNAKTTKTREQKELNDLSKDEIIDLENDMDDFKYRSSNIPTYVLNDEESNPLTQTNTAENKTHPANEKSPLPKVDAENVIEKAALKTNTYENKVNTIISPSLQSTEKQTTSKNDKTTNIKILKEPISVEGDQYKSDEQLEEIDNIEKQNVHIPMEDNPDKIKNDQNTIEVENTLKRKENTLKKDNITEFKTDANDINSSHVEKYAKAENKETPSSNTNKIKIISNYSFTPYFGDNRESNVSDCKSPSKQVDFVSSISNDKTIKTVYPKTPGSTKTSNNFYEDNSFQKDGSFQAGGNLDSLRDEINDKGVGEKELNIIESKLTPTHCSKSSSHTLEMVQSSTPIGIEKSKNEKDTFENKDRLPLQVLPNKLENSLKEKVKDDDETKFSKINVEVLKWVNPCVKGTSADGSKLDVIISNSIDCYNYTDSVEKHTNKKKSIIFSSEDENEEEVDKKRRVLVDDDDGETELEPGEKPYKRKHDFHDDEAMEVLDYESGDSMDSEERREMEENQLRIEGESIGSYTTDEDHNEHVEEEDSENVDSFIVSDSEEGESLESYDDDENIDADISELKRKKKVYKRFKRPTESSSSSDEEIHHEKENLKDAFLKSDNIDKNSDEKQERLNASLNSDLEEEKRENGYTTKTNPMEMKLESNSCDFIADTNVSDSEEGESLESYDDDEHNDEDISEHKRKKKVYKRVKRPTESSSSSDEEIHHEKENLKDAFIKSDNINKNSDEKQERLNASLNSDLEEEKRENGYTTKTNPIEMKLESNSCDFIADTNVSNKNILDSSKLSDSALRLQCSAESESDEGVNAENTNISRKEILRKLNQSDRFNKSVRDLNPEIDTSPVENVEYCLIRQDAKVCGDKNNAEESSKVEWASNSFTELAKKSNNGKKIQSESHLGEVSVTSESDADKENGSKSLFLSNRRKTDSGLSASFSSYKKKKEKQEWQRSFKIGVTVKSGEIETNVTDVQSKETESTTLSSTEDQENGELGSKDIRYLENIRHIPLPLGNPLIRTRRQSLALPTNPDMEICSSSHGVASIKKPHRISLGVLSSGDFNPSQSFVDSIELQKTEHNRYVAKRKRLSKSFCGASETLDNSVVDIDVRHLNKRSRLISENSIDESQLDSIENINSSKLFTKISSTPHEKINKNDSSKNMQRILSRCEEILEAANLKKLEAKNNKKSKFKISNKRLKKKSGVISSDDRDCALKSICKDLKRKDKTKWAISQAIKAADLILGKKKKIQQCMNDQDDLQCSGSNVLEATEEYVPIKKCIKEISDGQDKTRKHKPTSTSAGKFMELPQSPERKKKTPTYIHLSTGIVSVEPVTPKKRSVQALNGSEFRESPITPALGFRVRRIAQVEKIESSSSSAAINRKRKRHHDKTIKHCSLPKSQWTQSGIFIEEVISKNRPIAQAEVMLSVCQGSQKSRKHLGEREHHANLNFKEIALMRPDIKRSTKRDILLLKERRQVQGHR